MFCLRTWASLLVFLSTASPLYTVLFLLGNYWLTRPCVYCSFLLCCIAFSLLDFEADWFEPRWSGASQSMTEAAGSLLSGNATFTEAVLQTASVAVSALNGTGGSLASVAMDGAKRKIATGGIGAEVVNGSNVFEWINGMLEKLQFRIPCVNVTVRL